MTHVGTISAVDPEKPVILGFLEATQVEKTGAQVSGSFVNLKIDKESRT